MDIVVSDTNIFIDLISVGLMEASCRLPIKIHTVDYVMNEITDDIQKEVINKLADEGKITVKHFSPEEFMHIIEIYSSRSNNVSVTDCSVWYYAKQNSFRLLTGEQQTKEQRHCRWRAGIRHIIPDRHARRTKHYRCNLYGRQA